MIVMPFSPNWYKVKNPTHVVKLQRTVFYKCCLKLKLSSNQTLLRDLTLMRLIWYSDSRYVSGESFLRCGTNYDKFGRRFVDSLWAGLGSDKCGQHNVDLCVIYIKAMTQVVTLYSGWIATVSKQNPGGHHMKWASCLRNSFLS